YYEREAQIGQCVRRVLVYPLILLGMMCTMILAINAHVLPVFEEVLESLGMQMSSRATGMMQMGTMITAWSAGLILCVLVSGLVLWGWLKVSGELTVVTRALHYFKSYETLEIQKFTSALTLLIGSGVPPEYAMEMARELVRHVGVRRKIDQSLVSMHAGQSLAQAVQESRLFSSLAVRMLIVGSRTGCLEEMMKKLATYYEEEVEETLERIVGRIEPITVIVLACVIGSILLSVMLPLMSMMSVIG
ncbi:MAG: type II secretion system F family protein, partial [Cellulosilyticaceae bacterium]